MYRQIIQLGMQAFCLWTTNRNKLSDTSPQYGSRSVHILALNKSLVKCISWGRMIRRVVSQIRHRIQLCTDGDGGHVEYWQFLNHILMAQTVKNYMFLPSYYNSPNVVMCVCVCFFFVELLFQFCPDRHQIWTPGRYSKGKLNAGVDLGSKVPRDPRGQKY